MNLILRFLPAFIGLFVVSFLLDAPCEAAMQNFEIAGLKVAAWLPDAATPGPWPVILFSHGFRGCNTQSTFLMKGLAADGYAVFAPNHRDAACGGGTSSWLDRPEGEFRDPAQWNDETYADRVQDMETLATALAADPRFDGPSFDWQHLGLAGHSLGGYTALELAGAWPKWKDPRVKAVLALSPFSAPYIAKQTLGGLDAPVMYQGGTWDYGITPFIAQPGGAYDLTVKPKYFIELDGAGHFAWTDLRATFHAEIVTYACAFFDHALKGKEFPPALLEPHGDIMVVRWEE